jgi:hypothetical protein
MAGALSAATVLLTTPAASAQPSTDACAQAQVALQIKLDAYTALGVNLPAPTDARDHELRDLIQTEEAKPTGGRDMTLLGSLHDQSDAIGAVLAATKARVEACAGTETTTTTPPATTPSTTPAPTSTPTPASTPPAGDLDCADFPTRADAQAVYDLDPSDPNRLDANGDGQACENFFDADDSTTSEDTVSDGNVPLGSVATGGL